MPTEGRAGTAVNGFTPTGLSQEIQRKRNGFLKPAASSTDASWTGTGAAGLTRSSFLSVGRDKSYSQV